MTIEDGCKSKNIHEQCGMAVDMVIKSALSRKSVDNVTCLIIAFENFGRIVFSDNNYFSSNNKEIQRPSILSSMEYYKTVSTRKDSKDNLDEKGRPRTNSFINNYSSNSSNKKNYTDNYNSESNLTNQIKPPIKSSQPLYDKQTKKLLVDISGSNKRLENEEVRKNADPKLSFVEKYKISPFSMNEINTHYPSTTKNIDPKFKTYNGINDSNKFINNKKGY
jgi:hypothetical protein